MSAFQVPFVYQEAERRFEERFNERVIARILEQMERELREGGPATLPTTEQAGLAMLKSIAIQLQDAGSALRRAAEDLKAAGRGVPANRAYVASQAALRAASDIIGDHA